MFNQVFQVYSFGIVHSYDYVNFLVSIGKIERVRSLNEEENNWSDFDAAAILCVFLMIRFFEVLWTVW